MTYHDIIAALRAGPYTSVGSYPVSGLFTDGGLCCFKCLRANVWRIARATRDKDRDGWALEAVFVRWENDEGHREYCEQCGDEIEVAYPGD